MSTCKQDSGQISLWHIYALTALPAVLPVLVPAKDLPNAFSMTSIAFQTGAIVDPAMSGFAIACAGQAAVYYINVVSFLAVILALVLIGNVSQTFGKGTKGISLSSIREGIRFILRRPIIFSTMILDFIATFFASANTLMPIVTRDVLRVGMVEYGWLSAAQSVGAVLAALVVSQVQELRRQGMLFMGSVFIFGAAIIVFGLSRSFALGWCALAITGAADGVSIIIRNTIRQIRTPDELRGRMTSLNQIFFQGGPQLGEIEAGLIAQFFGAPLAIISGGIGCIVGALWISRT